MQRHYRKFYFFGEVESGLLTGIGFVQIILGPSTVGGIQAGAFKIGDTAGTLDNIIHCKLHRPGSVGFVSKSVSSPRCHHFV